MTLIKHGNQTLSVCPSVRHDSTRLLSSELGFFRHQLLLIQYHAIIVARCQRLVQWTRISLGHSSHWRGVGELAVPLICLHWHSNMWCSLNTLSPQQEFLCHELIYKNRSIAHVCDWKGEEPVLILGWNWKLEFSVRLPLTGLCDPA